MDAGLETLKWNLEGCNNCTMDGHEIASYCYGCSQRIAAAARALVADAEEYEKLYGLDVVIGARKDRRR